MAIPRGGRNRADEELSVPELLEELRESRRVQGELVAILHHDGEARTRRSDGGFRGIALAGAVPFVLGVLIGALGTYAGIAGRLATLEAGQSQLTTLQATQTQLTSGLREDVRAIHEELRAATTPEPKRR